MSEHPNGAPAGAPAKPRIVFEFDPATGTHGWRVEGPGYPLPLLVNDLELLKQMLLGRQFQEMQARQQPGIVMPDGSPPPRW